MGTCGQSQHIGPYSQHWYRAGFTTPSAPRQWRCGQTALPLTFLEDRLGAVLGRLGPGNDRLSRILSHFCLGKRVIYKMARARIGCLGRGFGRWSADERGLYHDNRQS